MSRPRRHISTYARLERDLSILWEVLDGATLAEISQTHQLSMSGVRKAALAALNCIRIAEHRRSIDEGTAAAAIPKTTRLIKLRRYRHTLRPLVNHYRDHLSASY